MQNKRIEFDDDPDITQRLNRPRAAVPADNEDRLFAAVQEYTAAKEAGRELKREDLLARYPDVADDLAACLEGLAFVNSAAAQIPGAPQSSVAASGEPVDDEPLSARPLGDFRLTREIGRGGMGVVYEAVQLSLGRRVAVKVLPLASALDSRQLQRFRNEAQAAAQLHHTNIVPVYAVGCERSVHFYAMQLIEGQSLADVIRELRKVAGRNEPTSDDSGNRLSNTQVGLSSKALEVSPQSTRAASGSPKAAPPPASSQADGSRLSSLRASKRSAYFRAVARLGLQAAEALDYAHRAGVVHRDIKPANLLLDAQNCLWITDFGLAQFYTDSNLTQTGDLVGTLRYMSPEQASGRAVVLDQRTDVYSLGVTLYEMLTLERALPGETREQLLQQLGSVDPKPARSIDKTIPPELETILIKATAKEPADRYASAKALAEDLARFLHDEPILARPPSLWDKSVKWTRRHKALALSALAMLVLASVGLLTSTLLIAREQQKTRAAYISEQQKATEAKQQRAQAEQSFNQAREARAQAERSFSQARDAVDFLSRVAADELAGTPESAEVRKEMLEAALDYYQGFLEDHQGATAVGVELDDAQSYVKQILTELSAFEDFDRIDTSAYLLSEPAVQQGLKLSADQISQAASIRTNSSTRSFGGDDMPGRPGAPPDFQDMTEEQKQERFAASASKIEASLKALLTPQQLSRLREISRQVRAPASFSDSDVMDQLSLTREQKESVRRAQAGYRIAMRKLFRPGGPGGPDGPHGPGGHGPGGPGGLDGPGAPPDADGPGREPPDSASAADSQQTQRDLAVGKILASLSASQWETWKKLTGEPFDGIASIEIGPSGPGGPGLGRHGRRQSGLDGRGPDHDRMGPGGPGHDGPPNGGPDFGGPDRGGPDRGGGPGFGPPPGGPFNRPGFDKPPPDGGGPGGH